MTFAFYILFLLIIGLFLYLCTECVVIILKKTGIIPDKDQWIIDDDLENNIPSFRPKNH